jgi:hypothetical protein
MFGGLWPEATKSHDLLRRFERCVLPQVSQALPISPTQ